jgi:hypothetical protein
MMSQLMNSTLPSTRIFWRRWLRLPEDVVNDPRDIEIVWRFK